MARALLHSLLAVPALLALAGCPVGGGAGGTPCEKACHKSLDLHCSYEPLATCVTACEDTRTATQSKPQYCQDAYAEYIDCIAAMASPKCGFKSLDPGECRPAMDHYNNYCNLGLTPDEPCRDGAPLNNLLCADKPQKRPRACPGAVEQGCVMGGDSDFVNLYCCPGDPVAGWDAGTPHADGGSGPDSGTAAPSDAGASGASDAGAGSADAGAPASPFDEVLDACSNMLACDYYGLPTNVRKGMYLCANWLINTRKPSTEIVPDVDIGLSLACGRSAATCNEFVLCMNGGAYDKAWCAANPAPACDGAKAVVCGSSMTPASVVTDCAPSGNACELVDGTARCVTTQSCPQAPGACTGATGYWKCESDSVTRATHVACASGSSCQFSNTLNAPACVGDTACSGASRCEGTVAVECATVGEFEYEKRTDCAQLAGYACASGSCSPSETQCMWTINADQCVGDQLQSCVAGRTASFDCKAHGFARCGDYNGVKTCQY